MVDPLILVTSATNNMDFLEKLKAFLFSIIAFIGRCPKLVLTRPQPPSANDPETLQPESSQQRRQPSLPRFTNEPETLQQQSLPPLSSTFNIELLQSTSTNQPESSKLKAFLLSIIAFIGRCPKLVLTRPQPPSANDPETQQPESSQPPRQPSLSLSTDDPETLQQQSLPPLSSTFNTELLQSTSTNQPESSQLQSHPPPPTPTSLSNLKKLESTLATQQRLQWKNAVLSFCFSYALAVSLQYAQTDHQANHPNSSFVLLSFLVLITFNLILVALFISPSYTKTSVVLEKVAFLVAAAAFCHATAIPFPFELKCAVWALFLLALLLITIFARC